MEEVFGVKVGSIFICLIRGVKRNSNWSLVVKIVPRRVRNLSHLPKVAVDSDDSVMTSYLLITQPRVKHDNIKVLTILILTRSSRCTCEIQPTSHMSYVVSVVI